MIDELTNVLIHLIQSLFPTVSKIQSEHRSKTLQQAFRASEEGFLPIVGLWYRTREQMTSKQRVNLGSFVEVSSQYQATLMPAIHTIYLVNFSE